MSLLLYLYVVATNYLFQLTTITSVEQSTEHCTEVAVLTLRGKDRWVYLFCYCWPFSWPCFSCVEIIQLTCVANRVTGFYVGLALAWKRLSIYLYYLVITSMLSFNGKFVIFLSRTVLESNQALIDVFKNMKM